MSASLGWLDLDKARHEALAGAIEINSFMDLCGQILLQAGSFVEQKNLVC
jgi:hypothetical protein